MYMQLTTSIHRLHGTHQSIIGVHNFIFFFFCARATRLVTMSLVIDSSLKVERRGRKL